MGSRAADPAGFGCLWCARGRPKRLRLRSGSAMDVCGCCGGAPPLTPPPARASGPLGRRQRSSPYSLRSSPTSNPSTGTNSPIWSTRLGAFETYVVDNVRVIPPAAIDSNRRNKVCLKGGLVTLVGGGVSSLNMQLPPWPSHSPPPEPIVAALSLHPRLQGESGTPVVPSGVVGDKRISLGVGAGGPGLAAQLEQGYRQAREVVRANNGIKILLQLLSTRMVTPPAAIDPIRALACRVLLGLARDDAIAHILTKLQVGKKLSELIRDTSTQTSGSDNTRWINELTQVAIELIAVLTNSRKESTLAATDAAAPALKRIDYTHRTHADLFSCGMYGSCR